MSRTILLLAALTCAAEAAQAQAREPWHVVADAAPAPDSALAFAEMAPGWHATAKTGTLAFDPGNSWTGEDSLESVVYLFSSQPGTGAGIMLGGRDLGTSGAHYVAFIVGPDGRYQITRRNLGVTTALIPWRLNPAVPHHPGGQGNVRAVLAVRADSANVQFEVNGIVVATLPKIAVSPAGLVGVRVERGTSAHIATLSIGGRNVAPVPAKTS